MCATFAEQGGVCLKIRLLYAIAIAVACLAAVPQGAIAQQVVVDNRTGATGTRRTQATADIPTIAEQNFAGDEADSWTGVRVPKSTSAEVVAQLQAEVVRVTNLPDPRERLIAAGFEPNDS